MKKQYQAFLGLLFITLLLYGAYVANNMETQSESAIRHGWQYRWGDSTMENDGDWQSFSFPKQPPGWDGKSVLWLRGKLSTTIYDHPVLYLRSVRQHVECFVDGKLIYGYGEIPVPAGTRYNPWFPWHMVLLPEDSAGKDIYVRIHSQGPTIGIGNLPRLSSLKDLLTTRMQLDFVKISMTALSFFVSIVALIIAVYKRKIQSYYALAGSAFCNGIIPLSGTFMLNLLFESFQFVLFMVMAGAMFWHGFWLWFLESGVESQYYPMVRRARNAAFAIAVASMLLLLKDSSMTPVLLSIIFIMLVVNISLMLYVFRGQLLVNKEAQIYAVGGIVWAIAVSLDVLGSMGMIILATPIGAFGQFIDMSCLIIILSRRVASVHDQRDRDAEVIRQNNEMLNQMNAAINQINDQLEQKVAERTEELTATTNQLQEKNKRLDIMERSRRHLLSNIAHDLRTPITMIRGYVEAILDGVAKEPEQQKKSLHIIHNKAMQLNRLIEDVFTLSRLESRTLTINKQQIKSGDLLQDIVTCYADDAMGVGVHLRLAVQGQSPDCIVAIDINRMEQVFANLIYNALRYTPREGQIILSVKWQEESREVIFAVQDTGCGIATTELQRIFERFYRGDDVSYSTSSGTGLGLAIVKEVVEMHDGRIWAESMIGQGSVFYIALPCKDKMI